MRTKRFRRDRRCAILFVRAPQIGAVKTRLGKRLDPDTVLQLYRCFAKDVIETVKENADRLRICYYPSNQRASVMDWLGEAFDYFPQTGEDLGERMANAFTEAFEDGCSHAVLIGSDIPDLPGTVIEEAFSALAQGLAVIGPAKDGGYYLIGFSRDTFHPSVFANMVWGKEDVFIQTLSAFEKTAQSPHVVAKWQDIDEYSDLLDLVDRCRSLPDAANHTLRYLKKIGIA